VSTGGGAKRDAFPIQLSPGKRTRGARAAEARTSAGACYSKRIMSLKNEAKFSEQTGGKSTLHFPNRSIKCICFSSLKK
jgi:hypothetical protein